MAVVKKFDDFKSVDYFGSPYNREILKIWDANLHYGDVRPFACPTPICNNYNKGTIFSIPNCPCLSFPDDRDVVVGFCHDQYFSILNGSLYQSTSSALCSNGVNSFAGAPFPPNPPSVNMGCRDDLCDAYGVAYVITYVTEHAGIQVESAPSPASTVLGVNQYPPQVEITIPPPPTGYLVTKIRLYRTETTFEDDANVTPEGAEFLCVWEFDNINQTIFFRDGVLTSDLQYPLTTYLPMASPAPLGVLIGLCRTDDGIAVCDKHRVYISRAGQPQFTLDGVVEIEDEIRAIRAIGNTIFVFTNNRPYKIGYRHTEGVMSIDRVVIQRPLPLVSKKSLSVWGSKIFFASTYSLYTWDIGGYGSDVKSEFSSIVTPEQWKNMKPESVRGTAYEYGYILSCDNLDYSLMIEYGNDGTETRSNYHVMPITYIKGDSFGLSLDGIIHYHQNNKLMAWDFRKETCSDFSLMDNSNVPACEKCECCEWKIELFYDNHGKNRFSKMKIYWDERTAINLNLNFYLAGFGKRKKITNDLKVISSRGFSIPKFKSSQAFIAEISGCGILHEVRMATSNQELIYNSNNALGN